MPRFSLQFEFQFPTRKAYLDGSLLTILRQAEEAVHCAGGAGGETPPPPVDLERVRVALREALANAAEHGNGYRPERSIRVVARADPRLLYLEVEDEGDGFDYQKVLKEISKAGARRTRGRGIHFMQGLADRVRFERGGSRVVLEFMRGRT